MVGRTERNYLIDFCATWICETDTPINEIDIAAVIEGRINEYDPRGFKLGIYYEQCSKKATYKRLVSDIKREVDYRRRFMQKPPAADANGAAGEGLRIGQLVRYTSKQSNEIAYGAFGVVKAVDMLTGWYDVLFFDYEGLRAINGIVLQSVLPENCNRAEAELTRLRSELDAARGALAEFVRIDDTCQAYSNTGLADFTETCAYVGRRPIEDALKRAKELSQP